MKAKLSNHYRKASGIVYVYEVTCTAEEIAAFKAAKGQHYRESDNGNPLFYSSRPLSFNRNEVINLTLTRNGNIVADDLNKTLSQEEKLEEYIIQEKAKIMAQRALSGGGLQAVNRLIAPVSRTAEDANIPPIDDVAIFGVQHPVEEAVVVEEQPLNV